MTTLEDKLQAIDDLPFEGSRIASPAEQKRWAEEEEAMTRREGCEGTRFVGMITGGKENRWSNSCREVDVVPVRSPRRPSFYDENSPTGRVYLSEAFVAECKKRRDMKQALLNEP